MVSRLIFTIVGARAKNTVKGSRLIEYRRAENRPWVAALVQKHFKLSGRAAEPTINDIEEYFETLVYDDDVSHTVCRACLEKAVKARGNEHLHTTLERAKLDALKSA